MSMSINRVTLLGNVGKDPEIRSTQAGKEIASFSVATAERWKDKNTGEMTEKTEWHRVVVFSDGLVKVVKDYLRKGSKVYLEGALQTRKWTDQQGIEKYSTEVVVQGFDAKLILLDGKRAETAPDEKYAGGNSDYDADQEIPF